MSPSLNKVGLFFLSVHDVDIDAKQFGSLCCLNNFAHLPEKKVFTINYVLIPFVIIILKFIENSPGNSCYYKHFTTGQVLIAKGNIKYLVF